MSKLRSVRTEIAKMKRELEAKEAAYRKEAFGSYSKKRTENQREASAKLGGKPLL